MRSPVLLLFVLGACAPESDADDDGPETPDDEQCMEPSVELGPDDPTPWGFTAAELVEDMNEFPPSTFTYSLMLQRGSTTLSLALANISRVTMNPCTSMDFRVDLTFETDDGHFDDTVPLRMDVRPSTWVYATWSVDIEDVEALGLAGIYGFWDVLVYGGVHFDSYWPMRDGVVGPSEGKAMMSVSEYETGEGGGGGGGWNDLLGSWGPPS